MTRILIPFSDPEAGRRAIEQLLAERSDPQLSVHLLAVIEPRLSGKVRIFVSPREAEAQVRTAGERWVAALRQMLAVVGVPSTSEVVIGPPRATIRAAALRAGIDRVLLPVARSSWWPNRSRARDVPHSPHRVTLVT